MLNQAERITGINRERKYGIAALSAVEVNVLFNENDQPALDLPIAVLAKLDLVVASRHAIAKEKELEAIKESLLFAVRSPMVDVIGHPDRFIPIQYSWDTLRANFPEAQRFNQEIIDKKRKRDETLLPEEKAALEEELQSMYKIIRKTIGRDSLEPEDEKDERLMRLREGFVELEERYWSTWQEILDEMKKNNKAFEVNLNKPPQPKLVEMAARTGVKFFINFDAHDFGQFKKEATELSKAVEKPRQRWAQEETSPEDLEVLRQYKLERLQGGPGVVAILRLVRHIRMLESFGVTPDRVVNSSRQNLLEFLTKERGRQTANLEFLTGQPTAPSHETPHGPP